MRNIQTHLVASTGRLPALAPALARAKASVALGLALTGSALLAAPARAQSNACGANWQCRDASVGTLDWCDQGQCRHLDRGSAQCEVSAAAPGCWFDLQCDDGDPNTVAWCGAFDWRILLQFLGDRAPGRCHIAPRDGSACDGGQCEPIQVVLDQSLRGAVNNPGIGGEAWRVPGSGYQIRYIRTQEGGDAPLTTSFTCFDTASLSGEVLSAQVEMTHSSNSYTSQDPSETVALLAFDQVGCDEAALANESDDVPENWAAIFQDINDGPVLATFTADPSDQGRPELIPLNQAGLDALQAALGSSGGFGLGGTLLTADGEAPGVMEGVFQSTDGTSGGQQPSSKLVVTIKPDTCPSTTRALLPRDVGYFARAMLTESQQVLQSFHFVSPDGEHKLMPVGNRNIDNELFGVGNVETRAYSVWDVSEIQNAVSAKLRIWGWQPSKPNSFSGAYRSDDASETIGLFSVDQHRPEQVIDAPFGEETNHTLDIPIFEDLGDGTLYGERVHTPDDGRVDLSPAFRADPDIICNPVNLDPGAPCGKWLEYELNAEAIAAINATNGLWAVGHAMTTIDANPNQIEWTNSGIIIDMATRKNSYPTYLSPEPQLIVRVAQ